MLLPSSRKHIQEDSFSELMALLARDRGRLRRLIETHGGPDGAASAVADKLGVALDRSVDDVVAGACRDDDIDGAALALAAEALMTGTEKTDQPRGRLITRWLASDMAGRAAAFQDYALGFLTQDGTPRARLITKKTADTAPDAVDALADEAARLCRVMEECRATITAQATVALLQLGTALLHAYESSKAIQARLDYDDLILKTIALLRENVDAAWVLFKLDGGLDHILIDEAQDTNPDQWSVVATLAEEFFAGTGAREDNPNGLRGWRSETVDLQFSARRPGRLRRDAASFQDSHRSCQGAMAGCRAELVVPVHGAGPRSRGRRIQTRYRP